MNLLIALLLAAGAEKTVTVNFTETAPRIDGVLESAWSQADSVTDFFQSEPDEGKPPTERTVVYVLQDRDNLYVAFRGYAAHNKPVAAPWGMEEEATIFLDPMGSGNSGYFFKVYGSGLFRSGKILDDGQNQDWSWDAVWFQADRLYDDRWEVEIKIPFKSLRYKAGATEWGVNFHRFITAGMENDFWTEVRDREGGNRVSRYGRLVGINPRSKGFYLEAFPEGFARYDQLPGEAGRVRPRASLNVKWDLTPQSTLNATALPDFAQIESDPYSFNLSRYPTRFSEQRPFFIEGSELFRMSGLGEGVFTPLEIFYSRRVGRAIGQEPVPILGGLKFTTKEREWSFGALGAYTDQLGDSTTLLEPRRGFAVLSGRTTLQDSSRLGVLLSGTQAASSNYNYAMGVDFNRSFGAGQTAFQAAASARDGKLGWAVNSGYTGFLGTFYTSANLQVIDDSFDVGDIGFVPWVGRKQLQVMSGPYFRGHGGSLTRLLIAPGFTVDQEPGSDAPSILGTVFMNPQFRNGWSMQLNGSAGQASEVGLTYFGRSVNLSANCAQLKYSFNLGGNYGYSYNYPRSFLADNYSDWGYFTYYLVSRVALMAGVMNYWEADPNGKIVGVTSVVSPRIDYRINARMSFNVYDEVVLTTPRLSFDSTRIATNRVGFLYSWNFLPKSWLYVALNDFRVDLGQGLTLASRVGAIKLRYLLYF
jgi:hypothetical protein